MERYDVSEGARLAEMVEAATHGGEVVITDGGADVARLIPAFVRPITPPDCADPASDFDALEQARAALPSPVKDLDWTGELRAMRDEDRF